MTTVEQNGQAEQPPSGPVSPRIDRPRTPAWMWVVLGGVVLGAGLLAVVRATVAVHLPELTDATFDSALERWDATGPESYNLEVQIEGLRAGHVVVEVRNGEVTTMLRDGQQPAQRRTWDVWTVPGMFEMIEREMELAADPAGELSVARDTRWWLRCEFDPHDGHPVHFHRAVFGGGPEVAWHVTRFEAL